METYLSPRGSATLRVSTGWGSEEMVGRAALLGGVCPGTGNGVSGAMGPNGEALASGLDHYQ